MKNQPLCIGDAVFYVGENYEIGASRIGNNVREGTINSILFEEKGGIIETYYEIKDKSAIPYEGLNITSLQISPRNAFTSEEQARGRAIELLKNHKPKTK